jgi:predicted transcriptional regulator
MIPKNAKQRSEQLKGLRDQHQAGVEAAQALLKAQQATRRALRGAMQAGPRTVPELATATTLPAREVWWHVVALKKYGLVAEAGLSDGYYQYRWVEEAKK